jgi:serine protease Do
MASSSGIRSQLGQRVCYRLLMLSWVTIAATMICQLASPALGGEVDATGAAAPLGFAEIIERVRPTVVGVQVRIEELRHSNGSQQESPFPPGSPHDRFLRESGMNPERPAPGLSVSLGSGFFVSGDGYIVTNNHVVTSGNSFEVTTDDGKVYPAKLIGTDPRTDLALIKIAAQTDLPYVKFAKAEPRIGDWVLPIGNPFGLGGTVTVGIVSARGRDIGEGPYDDFIQIDAPVNSGNSGGPTFNVKGEVIGVNTAIYSPSGLSIGVAFDIPAETIKLVVQQLKEQGHVTRGWIGVQIQPVTPTIAEALGLATAQGGLVAQLEPTGPAAKQGIEVGDVITSVNDHEVKDSRALARTIAGIAPGTSAKFGIFRNGEEKSVAVLLGELPRPIEGKRGRQETSENIVLGLTLAPANSVPGVGEKGVVVMDISPEGGAADSGLQIGDIVLTVGGRAVNAPADVSKIVDEARAHSKHVILMHIKRADVTSFVAVPIG